MTRRSNPGPLASTLLLAVVAALLLVSPFAVAQQPDPFNPRVTFAWDANSEADLAGYVLVVQSAGGSATNIVKVPETTCVFIPTASMTPPWSATVRAYNTAGMLSIPSAPLVITAPSQPISLRVSVSIELNVGETSTERPKPSAQVIASGMVPMRTSGRAEDGHEWKTEAP